MNYKVLYLSEYLSDLDDAVNYYESISKILCSGFIQTLEYKYQALIRNPNAYGLIGYRRLRRIILKPFPYKMIYLMDEKKKQIILIALVHTARSKGFLSEALKSRKF